MEQQGQSNSGFLILQAMANMFICKRFFIYFLKKNRQSRKAIRLAPLFKFLLFALLLLALNQGAYFLTKPQNLYSELGVYRSTPFQQISKIVEDRKLEILNGSRDLGQKLRQIKELQEKQKVLTHSARRLTYDSFGMTDMQYAWSFTFPQFILSMIVNSSMFYLIALVMNLLGRDKEKGQNSFKTQLIYIILAYIVEIQLIIHTEGRLGKPTDFLDYIYPAFPMFERRHLIKITVIPITLLIDNFYHLFLLSEAEQTLEKLIGWMKPQTHMEVRGKLKVDLNPTNQHLNEQVEAQLQAQRSRFSDKNDKLKVTVYERLRNVLQDYIKLESQNISKGYLTDKIKRDYLLQLA